MTPSELRISASNDIESAALILDSDVDKSAGLATRAAMLALKARYASRQGWNKFPSSSPARETIGQGDAAGKNLEALLTLNGALTVQKAEAIDWSRVADWDGIEKPASPGSIDVVQAGSRIDETRDLIERLAEHEIIEQLMKLEVELADEFGPISVFSWVKLLARIETRQLLISGWGVPVFKGHDGKQLADEVGGRAKERVGADLADRILGVIVLDPRDPRAKAYMWPNQGRGSPRHVQNRPVDGIVIVDSFQITNQVIEQPAHWTRPGDDPPKAPGSFI